MSNEIINFGAAPATKIITGETPEVGSDKRKPG